MANTYEAQCYERYDDLRGCKQHMGLRHRQCLSEGVDRAGRDETPRPIRYDQAAYDACMARHIEQDMQGREGAKK